tara:strand:+ start:131 stop:352 length:222 start_codon:yes stop_codon:yes gene_type:complete
VEQEGHPLEAYQVAQEAYPAEQVAYQEVLEAYPEGQAAYPVGQAAFQAVLEAFQEAQVAFRVALVVHLGFRRS